MGAMRVAPMAPATNAVLVTLLARLSVSTLPLAAASPPVAVRLARRPARHGEDGIGGGRSRWAYVGRIDLGDPMPQPMLVAFDTASGNLVLPAWACESKACLEHRRYSEAASTSASTISSDGRPVAPAVARDIAEIGISSMDFGDGRVQGELLGEKLCLGEALNNSGSLCLQAGIIAGAHLDEVPFRAMPQDGILGLGRRGLSVGSDFSLLGRLRSVGDPIFSFYLARSWGEVTLGAYQPKRLAAGPGEEPGTLTWVPVPAERHGDGYWEVRITAVRAGNQTVDICPRSGCRGIVDSGSTRVGVQAARLASLQSALGIGDAPAASRRGRRGCTGTDLQFEVSGIDDSSPAILVLRPSDYSSAAGCGDELTSLDLPEAFSDVIILGEPLLRRYYSVFSWDPEPRIGFGLAASPTMEEEHKAATANADDIEALARDSAAAVAAVAAATAKAEAQSLAASFTAAKTESSFYRRLNLLAQFLIIQAALSILIGAPQAVRVVRALLAGRSIGQAVHLARLAPMKAPPENMECSICLGSCEEDLKTAAAAAHLPNAPGPCSTAAAVKWSKLRCGHSFHEGCILQWLQRGGSCPVCRGQA